VKALIVKVGYQQIISNEERVKRDMIIDEIIKALIDRYQIAKLQVEY
jgi:hypothetical protein